MSHALKMTRHDTHRRPVTALHSAPKLPAVRKVGVTLGDLIAAAFDTVGGDVQKVARLLTSSDLGRKTDRRIVLAP